jgi:hypothetical protein
MLHIYQQKETVKLDIHVYPQGGEDSSCLVLEGNITSIQLLKGLKEELDSMLVK